MSIGLGGKFFMYKFSKWLCALWSGAPCRRSKDVLFSTMQKNCKFETFIYNNKNGCGKKWWQPKAFFMILQGWEFVRNQWNYVHLCKNCDNLGMNTERKDQHKQTWFKMSVAFGKRTSKEGHKMCFFIVGWYLKLKCVEGSLVLSHINK